MHQYIAEAFVAAAHAHRIAEEICARIQILCRTITNDGVDKLLGFDDGRAIMRPADDGLLLRVSARDLVTFYGIRALLEGSLAKFSATSRSAIEWLPADGIPFREIGVQVRSDRHSNRKGQ